MRKITRIAIQDRVRAVRAEPGVMLSFNVAVLLVGLHSILLGSFIFFFTDFFYGLFFGSGVENAFFVRQSGIFLVIAGFFYLSPLLDLRKFYILTLFVIGSKITAVIFLLTNAQLAAAPLSIYAAAAGDGLMAIVLTALYVRCKKEDIFNPEQG